MILIALVAAIVSFMLPVQYEFYVWSGAVLCILVWRNWIWHTAPLEPALSVDLPIIYGLPWLAVLGVLIYSALLRENYLAAMIFSALFIWICRLGEFKKPEEPER